MNDRKLKEKIPLEKTDGLNNARREALLAMDLWITCLHEAAHAVVARIFGSHIGYITVQESNYALGGILTNEFYKVEDLPWRPISQKELGPTIQYAMAGEIAEIYLAGFSAGPFLEAIEGSDGWKIEKLVDKLNLEPKKRARWMKRLEKATIDLVLCNQDLISAFAKVLFRKKTIMGWKKIETIFDRLERKYPMLAAA